MNTTRRTFVRNMGLAGAAIGFPTIIPSRVLGADAPSNKINILQIGCGRIGRDMDMPGILRQDAARLVAVCDLDSLRSPMRRSWSRDITTRRTSISMWRPTATTARRSSIRTSTRCPSARPTTGTPSR